MEGFNIGDLKIKVPIVQGGMGVAISLSGLASAVANNGGIGVISAAAIGMKEMENERNYRKANKLALQKEIRKAKSLSNGVIGVNIMMALTDHEDLIKVAVEENIDLVIMGAGLPLRIPAILEEAGLSNTRTKFAVKVSSAKAARLIFQSWSNKYHRIPDAVVVEGPLAGGHLGFKKEEVTGDVVPLRKLVEETVREVSAFSSEVPVIAAGGIYTGKDMFEIMQAGAKAVKMGTRFVTTHECDADIAFKNSYLTCNQEDIVIINSPVGLPGRVVRNEFVDQIYAGNTKPFKCGWNCLSSCDYRKAPYCIAQALYNASKGVMAEGFAFCGSNAYRATKIQSVSEVMNEVMEEYRTLKRLSENDIPLGAMPISIAS
ncbi:MAG TPA: nitronate monooxygenase [Bacteroidales bacterium]|nr:nitronate monooxygenase [Bacteroidales bacterium]